MLNEKIKTIHFVGIGGAGVSALANLALKMGYKVTGSDLRNSKIIHQLELEGAKISIGHDPRNVRTADLVVYSTAINPDKNVETEEAYRREIPVTSRIDFLAYLVRTSRGIVISGSHGKSTTSALIAHVLNLSGLSPTFAIGARIKGELSNANQGESDLFVCEGDESNNGHQELKSWISVVTNIDDDHLDFHKDIKRLQESFHRFIQNTDQDGAVVACIDCSRVRELLGQIEDRRVITYGLNSEADYYASEIIPVGFATEITVAKRGEGELGRIKLPAPGNHNVQNSLAAVAVAEFCGIDFQKIAYAIENFPGLERRFDILLHSDELIVVDDYAHHPTEICALIAATRERTNRRLRVIFQPHRFTRSKAHAESFPACFEPADEVILTDIYSAGEEPLDGMELDYLRSFFEERLQKDKFKYFSQLNEVSQYLIATLRSGDLIMTVGAGDVHQVAETIAQTTQSAKMREKLVLEPYQKKSAEGGLFG